MSMILIFYENCWIKKIISTQINHIISVAFFRFVDRKFIIPSFKFITILSWIYNFKPGFRSMEILCKYLAHDWGWRIVKRDGFFLFDEWLILITFWGWLNYPCNGSAVFFSIPLFSFYLHPQNSLEQIEANSKGDTSDR
jgi:hypothetical protein